MHFALFSLRVTARSPLVEENDLQLALTPAQLIDASLPGVQFTRVERSGASGSGARGGCITLGQ